MRKRENREQRTGEKEKRKEDGVMTERSNVIVLKTIMGKTIVGSNPTHT